MLPDEIETGLSHTIRIEMKDGSTLLYAVSGVVKNRLFQLLKNDAGCEVRLMFIWFYIPADRLVFVNISEMVRITFCFDFPGSEIQHYHDNFHTNVGMEPDGIDESPGFHLPRLIITHRRSKEDEELVKGVTMKTGGYFGNVSLYSGLGEGEIEGIEFGFVEGQDELFLILCKYLQFIDDDGESNFMPFNNLSVVEVERSLVMSKILLAKYLN